MLNNRVKKGKTVSGWGGKEELAVKCLRPGELRWGDISVGLRGDGTEHSPSRGTIGWW